MNDFSVCLNALVMTYLHLLVDGLQEFPLMVAYSGMVNLLDQLGVFVDEPRLPQHIGCCVFYLRRIEQHAVETAEQGCNELFPVAFTASNIPIRCFVSLVDCITLLC